MSLMRSKPLQTLYEEVANYDLVLVPDAPLASAINRRLDQPHFGTFATTPRRYAAGRTETAEDRLAFLELVDEVDASWKELTYAIENVLGCWEYDGTRRAVLAYERFVDETTEEVVEALADVRTTVGDLEACQIDDGQSVAVAGIDQFTPLERSILPDDYDTYSFFLDDGIPCPTFSIFDSPSEIVDALVTTIDAETADDVAVVLDAGSQYSSLVEAALETADIPFYGGPGFADEPAHRAYLQLLRLADRGSETTVGDVRPLLSQLGRTISVEHDEKRLAAFDHPEIDYLQSLVVSIETRTFGDVLDAFEAELNGSLERLREELAALGLHETQVTRERVDDLATYLSRYEVPIDREDEGVLLADAQSAGYVDRPVVFHLGLDESWTHSVPQRPWVDVEAQVERYIQRFQLVLQSGSDQYYLVQDTNGGQPVTPCLYFSELLDEDFERFSDLDSVTYTRSVQADSDGFDREALDDPVEPSTVETISQSSLNTYVNSPRDYFFSRLVDSPDRDYFREGNLFHDFAEFYVAHPDVIDDVGLDTVVEVMHDEAQAFHHETEQPLAAARYRAGCDVIVEYLDAHPPDDGAFLTPASGWGTNTFVEHFDEPIDSPITERWFENDAIGVKGKIDLVHGPNRLLDYKSGSQKSAYSVVKQSAMDPPTETVNYQALAYLSHYRTVRPDEQLTFAFLHFLEPVDDVVAGDANIEAVDIEDAVTTVTYYPMTFEEYVATRDAYDVLMDGYNDCVATFEALGFERYRAIMAECTFPETTDRSELRAADFAASFTDAVDAATGEDVDADKGCDQAIRALNGVRKKNYFEEDLDRFESFVEERVDELNARRGGKQRFPIDGLAGEPNERRLDHPDLLLEGER